MSRLCATAGSTTPQARVPGGTLCPPLGMRSTIRREYLTREEARFFRNDVRAASRDVVGNADARHRLLAHDFRNRFLAQRRILEDRRVDQPRGNGVDRDPG